MFKVATAQRSKNMQFFIQLFLADNRHKRDLYELMTKYFSYQQLQYIPHYSLKIKIKFRKEP